MSESQSPEFIVPSTQWNGVTPQRHAAYHSTLKIAEELSAFIRGSESVKRVNSAQKFLSDKRARTFCRQLLSLSKGWRNDGGLSGICGVGVGTVGHAESGEPGIKLYVTDYRRFKRILSDYLDKSRLPGTGVRVELVESGVFEAAGIDYSNPAFGGCCIGHPKHLGGSIACKVRWLSDPDPNAIYLLSAAHVLAASNYSRAGEDVWQPSARVNYVPVKGHRSRAFAKLAKFTPLVPNGDADVGLAKLNETSLLDDRIWRTSVKPMGIRQPILGEPMWYYGSGTETGLSKGVVSAVGFGVQMRVWKNDHVKLINMAVAKTDIAKGGDSGALVLGEDNYAIGVVCAIEIGSEMNNHRNVIFTPFPTIVNRLGVELPEASKIEQS